MTRTTRFTKGVVWAPASALCALSLLFGVADTRAATPTVENWTLANVAVVKAAGAREGSALACARDLVAQGVSVKEALDRCFLNGDLVPAKPGIDSFFGLGGVTASTSIGTASCGSSGVRPELGADYGYANWPDRTAPPNPNEGKLGGWAGTSEYQGLKAEAQKQWQEYYDLLDKYASENSENWTPDEKKQKLDQLNKEHQEANAAIDKRDAWKPSTVQTDPNAENFCVDTAAFIGECNRSGWKTSPCRILLGQLEGCSDPTVTDPAPDGGDAVGCKQADPDAKTIETMAALVCHMRIQPAPGEDPCVPTTSDGIVLNGWVRLAPCREGGDHPLGPDGPTIACDPNQDATPCGAPVAHTQEDQCLVNITVAQFGQKNIDEILAIAGDKLGGPVFVVPMPKGPPIPGGPDPDRP
jgi:hypothetical protein